LARIALELSLDLRYVGQSFEITTPVGRAAGRTGAAPDSMPGLQEIAARFHRLHRQRYGHASPTEPIEIVNLRVKAIGRTDKPAFAAEAEQEPDAGAAIVRQGQVIFSDGQQSLAPVYDRTLLHAGNCFAGPAIVVQMDATTVVPPGWCARVDGYRNLELDING
jgi:N-methylhydantoinase A